MPITIIELAGKLAGIIAVLAYIPYIIAILRNKTSPNRATWFIWALVSFIMLISYYLSGARNTIWLPLGYVIGSSVIAILSIWYGEGGWTILDRSCLLGAGASIALGIVLKIPQVVLFTNILNDFFGMLPTIKKSYLRPQSENKLAWIMFFTGSAANIVAVDNWNFSIATYPIVLFCETGIIIFLLFLSPHRVMAKS